MTSASTGMLKKGTQRRPLLQTSSPPATAHEAVYQVMTPGTYDIYFTANGAPTQVLYHTGSFPLLANQNRTVLFLNVCPITGNSCNLSGSYTALTLADLN